MKHLLLVVSLVGALSAPALDAQSVLDRPLSPDMLGDPVVWVPDGLHSGLFAQRIAQAARVPLVFEALAHPGSGSGGLPQRVALTGMTVRAALDVLVLLDARYRWADVDGVIVIRPAAAWDASEHPLNHIIADIAWDNVTAENVMNRAMALVVGAHPSLPPSAPAIADHQTVSIHVASGSVIDVLAAAARAHGTLMWSIPDGQAGSVGAFSFGFRTFEGRGLGVRAPGGVQ